MQVIMVTGDSPLTVLHLSPEDMWVCRKPDDKAMVFEALHIARTCGISHPHLPGLLLSLQARCMNQVLHFIASQEWPCIEGRKPISCMGCGHRQGLLSEVLVDRVDL